jgi:hypothetical protein
MCLALRPTEAQTRPQDLSNHGLGLVKLAMTDFKSPDKHLQELIDTHQNLDRTLDEFRSLSLDSVKKLFSDHSDGRLEELFNEYSPLDRDEEGNKSGPIDAIYSIYL